MRTARRAGETQRCAPRWRSRCTRRLLAAALATTTRIPAVSWLACSSSSTCFAVSDPVRVEVSASSSINW